MAVDLDKPHRWKTDIAESVRAYNRWFLASTSKAFRAQRELAAAQVHNAMTRTANLTRIDFATLEDHPRILPSFRTPTCPRPRQRSSGWAGWCYRELSSEDEKEAVLPPRMPPVELYRNLAGMGSILTSIVDQDISPWIAERRTPVGDETKMASIVIAKLPGRHDGQSDHPQRARAASARELSRDG